MADPLTSQSFFGEKISLKRRKTPRQSDRITFSSIIFFQILFSLLVKFNYSNMVNPGNFMI